MDHGEVTAGDSVTIELTFDKAATCQQTARIYFRNPDNVNEALDVRGELSVGKDSATITTPVPKDYRGRFTSSAQDSFLFPCLGYSLQKPFVFDPITFNVQSIPDPNVYPSRAGIAMSLTQTQFLDTKIAALKELSSEIDTHMEKNGMDSSDLRTFLTATVSRAQSDLELTERQYKTEILKSGETPPAFFDDFHRQYGALLIELRAPIPGTRAEVAPLAHLIYVQQPLKRRSESGNTPKPRNLSGTTPAIARAVKTTLSDNASAYSIVKSTGKAIFHTQFSSIPTGATIYYRQAIIPDFKVWLSKTDTTGGDFDLATFIFKFQKDGCEDSPVVQIDPYDYVPSIISIEFKRCKKR